MKKIFALFVCITTSAVFADDHNSESGISHEVHEEGDRASGYRIVAKDDVQHETGKENKPVVLFYVVDKSGKMQSTPVGRALHGQTLTFQWTKHQTHLLVTARATNYCWPVEYAKDANGNFKQLWSPLGRTEKKSDGEKVRGDGKCDKHVAYDFSEMGERSLGFHIQGEEGVRHDAYESDTPEVNYYIVDQKGQKRSPEVESNLLPLQRRGLTFVWLNHQRCLLVLTNGRKFFLLAVYGRDAKGNFKKLDADLESEMTRKRIAVAIFLKVHPEWSHYALGPFREGDESSHRVVDAEGIPGADFSADDTTVYFSVQEDIDLEMGDATVSIRYRFDAKTHQFTRLHASLLGERLRPVLTLSNEKLEKAIKKIALTPDQ